MPLLCCQRDCRPRTDVSPIRGYPVKARLRPFGIIEAVNVTTEGGARLGNTVIGAQIHLLIFYGAPELLDEQIVSPCLFFRS